MDPKWRVEGRVWGGVKVNQWMSKYKIIQLSDGGTESESRNGNQTQNSAKTDELAGILNSGRKHEQPNLILVEVQLVYSCFYVARSCLPTPCFYSYWKHN